MEAITGWKEITCEWAALQAGAEKEEILTLMIEKALELLFKIDRLFQESIDNSTEPGMPRPDGKNPAVNTRSLAESIFCCPRESLALIVNALEVS